MTAVRLVSKGTAKDPSVRSLLGREPAPHADAPPPTVPIQCDVVRAGFRENITLTVNPDGKVMRCVQLQMQPVVKGHRALLVIGPDASCQMSFCLPRP